MVEYIIQIQSYQKKNIIIKQLEIEENIKKFNKHQMWLNVKYNIKSSKLEKRVKKNKKNKGYIGLISSPFVHKKGGKSFKEQVHTSTINICTNANKNTSKTLLISKILGNKWINNKYEIKLKIKEYVK